MDSQNGLYTYMEYYSHFKRKEIAENKMVGEWVDMEYICLHRYIKNITSDTEVSADHQLRADRGT